MSSRLHRLHSLTFAEEAVRICGSLLVGFYLMWYWNLTDSKIQYTIVKQPPFLGSSRAESPPSILHGLTALCLMLGFLWLMSLIRHKAYPKRSDMRQQLYDAEIHAKKPFGAYDNNVPDAQRSPICYKSTLLEFANRYTVFQSPPQYCEVLKTSKFESVESKSGT